MKFWAVVRFNRVEGLFHIYEEADTLRVSLLRRDNLRWEDVKVQEVEVR